MKLQPASKVFGSIAVHDESDLGACRVKLVSTACVYDGPLGPIDEMIKALRDAANWLEWRRACERGEDG